jgi:hypothetical protein
MDTAELIDGSGSNIKINLTVIPGILVPKVPSQLECIPVNTDN